MIIQCMKCNQRYENGCLPIELSAVGHYCPMEPIVVSAPQSQAGTVAAQGEAVGFEIRCNEDGTLDEVVGTGSVHLEQMNDGHWWLGFGEGPLLHVNLTARGKIKASVMDERIPTAAPVPAKVDCVRCGNRHSGGC